MKVMVSSVSGDYPTITGYHDFESLDKAVDFVRFGAKGFDKEQGDDLILYFRDGKRKDEADVEIVIYDDYVE